MNFSKLMQTLEKARTNQANYQKVVICHLSQTEFLIDSKFNIANSLKAENPQSDHEISYYKSMSCPVWKVLKNKGLISIEGDFVKLNTENLTESQRKEIQEACV